MITNNYSNNFKPQFKGNAKIIYKTPEEFENLVKKTYRIKEFGIFPKYQFRHKIETKYPKFSQGFDSCVGLFINDHAMHFAPEQRERDLLEKVKDLIQFEKAKDDDVTAFIIGGRSLNRSKDSFNLANDLGNLCDKEGVDFSMITSKFREKSRDMVMKNKDTFIFSQENNPDLNNLIKQKDITPDQLENEFNKYMQIIDISPNHKIDIQG